MNAPGQDRKASPTSWLGSSTPSLRVRPNHVPTEARRHARPIRAVVAEDSPMVLKTLSSILEEREDVQLIGTATDGYHALRRVVELAPDLVLLDVRLPGINGLEAARRMKARSQRPVIIVVAADDTPGSHAAARAAGTDGIISRQHLFTQLRAAIRKLFPGPIRGGRNRVGSLERAERAACLLTDRS